MNWGGNIAFLRKNASGAPFPANAADNGLSVDATTGRIVLGNDAGGTLAQLLSNREIPMDQFLITLLGALKTDGQLVLSAGTIDPTATGTKMNIEGATTTQRLIVFPDNDPYTPDPTNESWHVFLTAGTIE